MSARATRLGVFLSRNVSSSTLFLAGALLFPAFLFQRDIAVRSMEVVLFFALNGLSGRRIRYVQSLVMAAGIVAFNLVIPIGRVLISPLGLPITEGALGSGLSRALTVIGMIALSQFSIRPDLRLPGSLGGLIGRSLYYFERIMAERKKVRRESLLQDIDGLLLSIHGQGPAEADPNTGSGGGTGISPGEAAAAGPARTTVPGVVLLTALLAANWALLAYTLIRPGLFWPR